MTVETEEKMCQNCHKVSWSVGNGLVCPWCKKMPEKIPGARKGPNSTQRAFELWTGILKPVVYEGYVAHYAAYIHHVLCFFNEMKRSIIPNRKVKMAEKVTWMNVAAKYLGEIGEEFIKGTKNPKGISEEYEVTDDGSIGDQLNPAHYTDELNEANISEARAFLASLIDIHDETAPLLEEISKFKTMTTEQFNEIKPRIMNLAKKYK